jgi:hypothetical protein
MGTENSSVDTRNRAKELSETIGSYHIDLNMDTVVTSVQSLFSFVTAKRPRFKVHGGSQAENLALQNIQVGPWYGLYADQSQTGQVKNGARVSLRPAAAVGTWPIWRTARTWFIQRRRSFTRLLYEI